MGGVWQTSLCGCRGQLLIHNETDGIELNLEFYTVWLHNIFFKAGCDCVWAMSLLCVGVNNVLPSNPFVLGSHLNSSISVHTADSDPPQAARWRGVSPSLSLDMTSHP